VKHTPLLLRRTSSPLGVGMTDAAEVRGVAGIPPEIFEHRHAGKANPSIVIAHAQLEQLERAVHVAERRIHHRQMQMLDELNGQPSLADQTLQRKEVRCIVLRTDPIPRLVIAADGRTGRHRPAPLGAGAGPGFQPVTPWQQTLTKTAVTERKARW
jgi:hypothetical protein